MDIATGKRKPRRSCSGQRSKPVEPCRGQAAPKEVRQANFRRQPSIATCDRIDRALEQRLYLLKLERPHAGGAGGIFHVLGSTGNVYTVHIGTKPSCDCPDFLKGRGPCKHILFIWLRVLRLEEDDYRIWQSALLTSELKSAVEPLFKRRAKWALPLAEKEVQDAFRKATRGDDAACGQNERRSCRWQCSFNWHDGHVQFPASRAYAQEYSPQFALRSYVFVELYALPIRLAKVLGFNKVQAFYCLRGSCGLASAFCEASFCDAVQCSCGTRVAILTLCFLAGASGMFHSSVAVLPSTTCMYAVLLGFAAWMRRRYAVGLGCGSFAVLLGMAVAAPMFVPMGLAALAPQNLGFLRVLGIAMLALLVFAVVPSLVDWRYYGSRLPVWTMGNHLLYNFGVGGGGAGADLYGTEPWTFYAKNLLLNFNLVALLAVPAILCSLRQRQLTLLLIPMYVTLAMFTKMAHKEERFLTMVYPLICLSAATTLDTVVSGAEKLVGLCLRESDSALKRPTWRASKVVSTSLAAAVVVVFATISCSRSAALHFHFRAPLQLYEKIYYQGAAGPSSSVRSGVCVGKEWYRFPSSFFLPSTEAGPLPLLWVNSSFDGQLPRPFAPWPEGLWKVPPDMNDRNLREPSRYHHEDECSLLVDLVLPHQVEEPPDPASWEEMHCEPFLDSDRSPLPWRAFYVPFGVSDKRNHFVRYCIWRRRT
ncbi:ALG9 [Symbiodinium sp. CCMP2592]|nr:ALG9 [Symbiodinium sp. CCMP2592]